VVTVAGHFAAVRGMERGPEWLLYGGWSAAALGFAWVLHTVAWWVVVS
jgi:hypothetical protein